MYSTLVLKRIKWKGRIQTGNNISVRISPLIAPFIQASNFIVLILINLIHILLVGCAINQKKLVCLKYAPLADPSLYLF